MSVIQHWSEGNFKKATFKNCSEIDHNFINHAEFFNWLFIYIFLKKNFEDDKTFSKVFACC